MKNETEVLTDLEKGTYSMPFFKTLIIYVRYCSWSIPENVLNEYTSPDISLFKEKQEIRNGIECFGVSTKGSWIMLRSIEQKDLIRVLLIKNENEKKMDLQNVAKSSFFTYEHSTNTSNNTSCKT